jgi:hypothetical protein
VLQKASIGDNPHYLDVWQPAHQGNADAAEKLISISFYSYASFVIFVLNSIFCKTDIHRPALEDPRSVPFNVDAAYAAGGATLHGKFVNVSIVLH